MFKKKIKNFNYEICDNGDVINLNNQEKLKGSISEHGYLYYRLSKNNQKFMFYAHNKLNNSYENLRLVTLSENVKSSLYITKTNSSCKKVEQLTLLDEPIRIFDSVSQAARELKLDSSSISKVCRGVNKSCGGFHFKYIK